MKKIILFITALFMLLAITGCSKPVTDDITPSEPVEELTGIPEVDNIVEDDQIELEPEHEHTLAKVEAKPATCVEYGNIEFYICSGENGCGQLFLEDGTQIKKSDVAYKNDHNWNSGEITKESTCTETGIRTITCSFCGKTRTESITKKDHQYDSGTITKEASCSETGVITYRCSACNLTKTEPVAKKEHRFDKGTVTTEPTCTSNGVRTYTCEVCGHSRTESIDKIEHKWGDYVVTKEPTCNEQGSKVKTCTDCGKEHTEAIEALGHNWDKGEITTKPTTESEGVKTYTCTRCGETKTEAIPKITYLITATPNDAAEKALIEYIGTGSGTKTSLNSGLSTIESLVGDYLNFLRGQKGYGSLKKSNGSLKKIARIRANDLISDFSHNSSKLDEAILKAFEDAGIEYNDYHCNEPVIYKASISNSSGNPTVICEQIAYRIAVATYESSGHWRGICSANYMLGISIINNKGTIYMCILSGTNPF